MEMGSWEEDRDLVTITCNEKAAAWAGKVTDGLSYQINN